MLQGIHFPAVVITLGILSQLAEFFFGFLGILLYTYKVLYPITTIFTGFK